MKKNAYGKQKKLLGMNTYVIYLYICLVSFYLFKNKIFFFFSIYRLCTLKQLLQNEVWSINRMNGNLMSLCLLGNVILYFLFPGQFT